MTTKLIARNFQIDIFEIVNPRALDDDLAAIAYSLSFGIL